LSSHRYDIILRADRDQYELVRCEGPGIQPGSACSILMSLPLSLSGGRSASRTDEKDGRRRDDKGDTEEKVELRRQPAAIEERAARERREYGSEAADADRPPHARGAHRGRVERRPDGVETHHRRVRDDAEQQRRPESDVQ